MKLVRTLLCSLLILSASLVFAQIKISAKNPVGILKQKRVAADLQLTPEQIEKIKKLDSEYMGMIKDVQLSGFSDPEDAKSKIEDAEKLIEKQIRTVLTEGQLKRRFELLLQLSGPNVLLDEPYKGQLKITDAQKESIEAMMDEYMEEMLAAQQSAQSVDEIAIKRNTLMKTYREKAEKLLTEEQTKTLVALKGKPLAD